MLKGVSHHQITAILLAVGGHTVLDKLMRHEMRSAIYQSLGVAVCVLIFLVLHHIVGRSNHDSN